MSTLFALLVGINQYDPNSTVQVPALSGCTNDIGQLSAFLEDLYPADRRQIQTLCNEQATYEAVVRGFGREHLLRAGKNDVVLIAYSGHGSREMAAPQWGQYFGDGKQETWVCYDSRTPNGLDLADKELAFLIESIANKGTHVVVIMDCCHSGSGTRYEGDTVLLNARQHSNRKQPRLWESYLNGVLDKRFPKGAGAYLPNSTHILLAACDRREKAWEVMRNEPHGLFSSSYMPLLETTGGRISYADLYLSARAEMMKITNEQHPQFESYGFFNAYSGFLGLTAGTAGPAAKIYFANDRWKVTQGALHRLPLGQPAVFEVNGQAEARAITASTGAEESTVYFENFDADTNSQYEARLLSLPAPPRIFDLKVAQAQKEALKTALDQFKPIYFTLEEGAAHASYCIEMVEDAVELRRTVDNLIIRRATGNDRAAMLSHVFSAAEHVARWEDMIALNHPTSHITPEYVKLTLTLLDAEGEVLKKMQQSEVLLDIFDNRKLRFRIEVENTHPDKDLFCALFYGSSTYGYSPAGFNECVPAGKTLVAWDRTPKGEPLTFQLNGKNSALDILQLIVSEERLTLANMTLKALSDFCKETVFRHRGVDDVIRQRDIGGGSFDFSESEGETSNDWNIFTLKIRNAARVAMGVQAVQLAQGAVTLLPHPAFRANAALLSPGAAGGYRESAALLWDYARQNKQQILSFRPPQPTESPLALLLLSETDSADSLSDQPLTIHIAQTGVQQGVTGEVLGIAGEKVMQIGDLLPVADGWEAHIRTLPLSENKGRTLAQFVFVLPT